ncbi:MAG TPA: carboxypeptidase-like regulatory domain-containing protein [Flavisolibacter sp.]|nr:carboxypeptidase-like regulatory domain-containing protein [Flavisolibacter sp.]
MKFLQYFLLLLFFVTSNYIYSQGNLSGQVVDAETQEPLIGASVFAQNTTRGTITDKEGNFSMYLNKGGYEIIVSFTGYENKKINLEMTTDRFFNLQLQKADNSLSEVIIKSTNEVADGWEKYGDFFLKHFIGATPFADSCTLQNPQALKFLFYKRLNRLKVLATQPLLIENRSLGYNLRYQLDSFVHSYNTDINSYRGQCLYTGMEGDEQQQKMWSANRLKAYYGSRLHFLRSYYDSSLKQEGFNVDILASSNRLNKFDRLVNPYDSAYYFFDDSTENAELWFPLKVSISYNKKAPEKEYLQQYKLPKDVPIQISYVDFVDAIVINPNGYFSDQRSWINQGYWSWKNLADQLPYDYEPEHNLVK